MATIRAWEDLVPLPGKPPDRLTSQEVFAWTYGTDHSSLAATSVSLRRLEGEEDRSWGRVAAAIGV